MKLLNFRGKLFEVVPEWKATEYTPIFIPPPNPMPVRRSVVRKKKRKLNKTKQTSKQNPFPNLSNAPAILATVPDIKRPFEPEQTTGILSAIPAKKYVPPLRVFRKRPNEAALIFENRKKRREHEEETKVEEASGSADGKSVKVEYKTNLREQVGGTVSGRTPSTLEEKAEVSGVAVSEIKEPKCVSKNEEPLIKLEPAAVEYKTRQWTIDEDRKLLYAFKDLGGDVELTVASVRPTLPHIPEEELRRRLLFLLSVVEKLEKSKKR